jgi:predicted adenine nucleotide alpha hydrolase (AANH) superfamily ATPase
MSKPRMLLHVCCAPCSTHVIEELKKEYDLTCFFYGPNIHPEDEYTRRMEESRDYCSKLGIEFIEGEYESLEWFQAVKGHESDEEGGERCSICHGYRLEKTAEAAEESGFELFATTLTISPHKNSADINDIGKRIEEKVGVHFLARDFKKMHGFQKSVEMSKEHGMYRQDYCGCFFSQQRSA